MTMTSDSSAAGAYRLEWKEFQSAFLDKLDSFRQCSTFSDVTLLSSDGSKSFEAHRLILTAGSGYFEEILHSKHFAHGRHPVICLRGLTARDIQCLLEFLYLGQAQVEQDRLQGFLRIAEELKIRGLSEEVSKQKKSAELKAASSAGTKRSAAESLPPMPSSVSILPKAAPVAVSGSQPLVITTTCSSSSKRVKISSSIVPRKNPVVTASITPIPAPVQPPSSVKEEFDEDLVDDEDLAAQEEENLERGAPGEDDEEEEEEEIDDDEEHMVISADPGLCQPTDESMQFENLPLPAAFRHPTRVGVVGGGSRAQLNKPLHSSTTHKTSSVGGGASSGSGTSDLVVLYSEKGRCHFCRQLCPDRASLKKHLETVHQPDRHALCDNCENFFHVCAIARHRTKCTERYHSEKQ